MQIILLLFTVCCSLLLSCAEPTQGAQTVFEYLLFEVEQDALLSFEEQHDKIKEFKLHIYSLSKEEALILTKLLLQETRFRITDILNQASLEHAEVEAYLAGYEQAILQVRDMTPEIARQMLFFVAELKIHRQYVYEFGIALGCEEKQLLRHDLCKLSVEQFEGYARYFRGGRENDDRLAYLAAWGEHQHEEHHHESYSVEGFDFDSFSEDRLRNNMLESVADLLAATKQRGGSTLIDWLVNSFPKKNPHPRLIPFLEAALIKAHAFYLDSLENQDADNIFSNLPCWSPEVEEVFQKLKR